MTDYNFRPQILVFFNIKEYIVSPYIEALDGRKSSKYFNGCVKVADVKKYIKETFYGGYGPVEGLILYFIYFYTSLTS